MELKDRGVRMNTSNFLQVRTEYSRAIKLLEEKLSAASSHIAKDKAALVVSEERIEQLENDLKLLNQRYEKRCSDVDEALVGLFFLWY